MVLRIKIPVDQQDSEVVVRLDSNELQKALSGQDGGACVVISRECGDPLHVRAPIEREAAC
jgi:hypothetical protein